MSKKLTPTQLRNIKSAEIIQLDPLDARKAFSPRELIQATLPHKNPKDVPLWTRKNGNYILTVQQGQVQGKLVGYPYGTIPRLLLYWITTEALRTGSRRLELGQSLADFMRKLGLDPQRGGKRSDAHRLRDQMNRLFRARISFEYASEDYDRWIDMQVAPRGDVWWSDIHPEQPTLMGSWIELGETFFDAIWKHPVPIDLRAVDALKNSALALDLYAWVTYRTYRADKRMEAQVVPWPALAKQFGSEYARARDFKRKAQQQLKRIEQVFPALRLEEDTETNCLIIKPARPAVSRTKAKRTPKPQKR